MAFAGMCPVNCFYDVELAELGLSPTADRPDLTKMLLIHPDVCIDCKACVEACPVAAIYAEEDVPEAEQAYIDINKNWFQGKDQAAIDAAQVP